MMGVGGTTTADALLLPRSMHGGLVADRSKASKQPRWMERKFCFISDAGNWGLGGEWVGGGEGEWRTAVQRPIPPTTLTSRG